MKKRISLFKSASFELPLMVVALAIVFWGAFTYLVTNRKFDLAKVDGVARVISTGNGLDYRSKGSFSWNRVGANKVLELDSLIRTGNEPAKIIWLKDKRVVHIPENSILQLSQAASESDLNLQFDKSQVVSPIKESVKETEIAISQREIFIQHPDSKQLVMASNEALKVSWIGLDVENYKVAVYSIENTGSKKLFEKVTKNFKEHFHLNVLI
jgi:hypothetical protein